MKVFMFLVGTPLDGKTQEDKFYLLRNSFENDQQKYFLKKEIINQDTQMQSLKNLGVDIAYSYLGARRHPIHLIKMGRKIRSYINQNNIDLVHVLWGSTTSLITVLFSPKPVVISFCGSDLLGNYRPDGSKTLSGKLSRIFSLISSIFAKKIITKSENLKAALWKVSQNKCTVIPNGVDLSLFTPSDKSEARIKLGWDEEEKIILFFEGSTNYVKNQPLAEKVVELVQQEISNVRMILVKNVPFENLPFYYNGADVMLLTSLHEGSNNSLKEAMACNLPIVSTNCGDAKERLKGVDHSFVLDTYNAKALASKVEQILQNGKRSNACDHLEGVKIKNVANEINKVYQSALK